MVGLVRCSRPLARVFGATRLRSGSVKMRWWALRAIIRPMRGCRVARGPCPPRFYVSAAALFVLLLAACSRTPPSAPATFSLPHSTPGPATETPALLQSPEPTSPPCINGAVYLEDLTVPDGSIVAPGAEVDKRWSVQNSGTCEWGSDYRLVHVGGDGLAGPDETALFPAPAGATAVWQVLLQAPAEPGEYTSRWQARAPDGSLFGDEVFVVVVVQAGAPEATATSSP